MDFIKFHIKCICLLFFIHTGIHAQNFSSQQKSWMFRIVMKTPSLKNNLAECFLYKQELPTLPSYYYRGEYIEGKVNWSLVDDQINSNPGLLVINFEALKSSSPGLLSELAVKLTLWELYAELALYFEKDSSFVANDTIPPLCMKMLDVLPENMKKGGLVKKKYTSVFYRVVNPSLSLLKKVEALSEVKSVSLIEQKGILDYWHKIVNEYVAQQSAIYFEWLAGRKIYYKGDLLAVGEGSASSGLLGEYEDAGDGYIQTGNGKGIGLFTYEMQIKRDQLIPKIESEAHILPLKNEPTLLHLSIWGMDGRKKPLVVIHKDDKSYLLFADFQTGLFSPDDDLVEGISYISRLKEEEEKEINMPLHNLTIEGGLLSVYQREDSLRQLIQDKVTVLELEIDSLQRTQGVSETAFDIRKRKLDVLISNLSDKDNRLQDVNRKISNVYREIERARTGLEKKQAVLGNNIQQWELNNGLYQFKDGTVFNFKTQDLIFYLDSIPVENELTVKLLAASYSLHSKLKDEVQLYINTTGGVGDFRNKYKQQEVNNKRVILEKTFWFKPDEYLLGENVILSDSLRSYCSSKKVFYTDLKALGVDSTLVSFNKNTNSYATLKNDSAFIRARRVELKLEEDGDSMFIFVKAFTDSGNTRLSKIDKKLYDSVHDLYSKQQSYNPGLSVLRLLTVVKMLERELGIDFSKEIIKVEPLNIKCKVHDFNRR